MIRDDMPDKDWRQLDRVLDDYGRWFIDGQLSLCSFLFAVDNAFRLLTGLPESARPFAPNRQSDLER
jgi:hypothetical protein